MLLKGVHENRALSLILEDFHQPLSDFFSSRDNDGAISVRTKPR